MKNPLIIFLFTFPFLVLAYFMRKTAFLKNFKISEFDSPDVPNSGYMMQTSTLKMLQAARDTAKIPFKITSGYRTKSYNDDLKKRGYAASPTSSHMKGYAVDISTPTKVIQDKILSACIAAGFHRYGVGSNFIHVDNDPDKLPRNWTY